MHKKNSAFAFRSTLFINSPMIIIIIPSSFGNPRLPILMSSFLNNSIRFVIISPCFPTAGIKPVFQTLRNVRVRRSGGWTEKRNENWTTVSVFSVHFEIDRVSVSVPMNGNGNGSVQERFVNDGHDWLESLLYMERLPIWRQRALFNNHLFSKPIPPSKY